MVSAPEPAEPPPPPLAPAEQPASSIALAAAAAKILFDLIDSVLLLDSGGAVRRAGGEGVGTRHDGPGEGCPRRPPEPEHGAGAPGARTAAAVEVVGR